MKVTRRDLFVWGAGAATGLVFTPVPWKLLDDVSIWSQNWPWIPQPTRGPIEFKHTFCSLCPQRCGLKVKLAGGWPVGVAGVRANPMTRGALCPLAFGAHQLNWHPQRLRTVRHKGSTASWGEARATFAKACSEGPVAVIDGQPGRATSSILASFAERRKGSYLVALSPETRALLPYESWSGVPASSLGYDLGNAGTIVSFGAPLLDGWGIPGRFTRLWAERAAGMNDPQLRLIQIEDSFSHTAARAWRWIHVRAGSDSALAAGLAQVLIEEHLVPAGGPVPSLVLSDAAAQTGLSENSIRELARTMLDQAPVLAIASDENPGVAALNVVLGAIGSRGGIVCRSKHAEKYVPFDDAIRKARTVLIDSSVPWDFQPQIDAEIFRFAAWDIGSSKSDWLLPAPGFLEDLTDVPTPPTSAVEIFAVAQRLVTPAIDVESAAQFLGSIDSSLPSPEKIIHQRCADLFHQRAGIVYEREPTPVAKFESVQKLEAELWKGAMWVGDPSSLGGLRCELKEWPTAAVAKPSQNWATEWNAPVLPPLATKLFRESSLREAPDRRIA